jgi:membrane fusion protein (multidrug efflux system)
MVCRPGKNKERFMVRVLRRAVACRRPPVGVVTVQPAAVPLMTELPGRLEAWRTAQVRARVPGIVAKAPVHRRQPMSRPASRCSSWTTRPYRATLDSAEATQAKAEANLAQAQAQVQRNQPLAGRQGHQPAGMAQTQVATLKTGPGRRGRSQGRAA